MRYTVEYSKRLGYRIEEGWRRDYIREHAMQAICPNCQNSIDWQRIAKWEPAKLETRNIQREVVYDKCPKCGFERRIGFTGRRVIEKS